MTFTTTPLSTIISGLFSSDTPYQIFEQDGVRTPTYTIGVAILWLPFYLVADLWSRIDPRLPADGMSQPYQWMVLLAGLFWLGIGLYSLLRFLGGYLRQTTVRVVIGLLVLATNLFYYAAVEPGMPHVYLFALCPPVVAAGGAGPFPRPWRGVAGPHPGCHGPVPAIRGHRPGPGDRVPGMTCGGWREDYLLRTNWKMFGLAVLSGLVIIFPQMVLWKMTTGHWVYKYVCCIRAHLSPHPSASPGRVVPAIEKGGWYTPRSCCSPWPG